MTPFLPVIRAFALWLAALPASARGLDVGDVVKAELLPGWQAADGRHFAALHLTLAPGWKTYWRAPGEAGIPPEFSWAGSGNLAAVRVHWPVPEVFRINDLTSIGYSGDLVLPFEIAAVAAGEPVQLQLGAELGVCHDICVPLRLDLAALLPASPGVADPVIAAALADRPLDAGSAGLAGLRCRVAPIADGLQLTAEMELPSSGTGEVAVVELLDAAVWASLPELVRQGGRLSLTADLVPADGAPFALDRSQLRFTVLGSDRALEFTGCPAG